MDQSATMAIALISMRYSGEVQASPLRGARLQRSDCGTKLPNRDVRQAIASADSNTSGRIADALHPVFEAPEVSVSATGRRRFPLHVPRTRLRGLQCSCR